MLSEGLYSIGKGPHHQGEKEDTGAAIACEGQPCHREERRAGVTASSYPLPKHPAGPGCSEGAKTECWGQE